MTTSAPQIFRFHDIAEVEVHSDSAFTRAFFEAEYGYHRLDEPARNLPRALLDFRVGSAAPTGFTRHTHKLLARWAYQLAIKPGEIQINAYGNRTAVSMVHHMLVHPSLRWLAAGGGSLLLHAGAVAFAESGRSLIFTGKGGAGKTTTTSLVLAAGSAWQFHADDYVFLGSGLSKAYVTRSHLYRDLQKWVPEIRVRLTPWELIRLEFFGALRKYSREGVKWPVRLGHQRLWPGRTVANMATPAAILLLERGDISVPGLIPVDNRREAANELLEMNFSEARHFLALLQKAGQLDQEWLATWKDTERKLLAKVLDETPAYRLMLPYTQSAEEARTTLLPLFESLVK